MSLQLRKQVLSCGDADLKMELHVLLIFGVLLFVVEAIDVTQHGV